MTRNHGSSPRTGPLSWLFSATENVLPPPSWRHHLGSLLSSAHTELALLLGPYLLSTFCAPRNYVLNGLRTVSAAWWLLRLTFPLATASATALRLPPFLPRVA